MTTQDEMTEKDKAAVWEIINESYHNGRPDKPCDGRRLMVSLTMPQLEIILQLLHPSEPVWCGCGDAIAEDDLKCNTCQSIDNLSEPSENPDAEHLNLLKENNMPLKENNMPLYGYSKFVEHTVSPWQPIEAAPKDGTLYNLVRATLSEDITAKLEAAEKLAKALKEVNGCLGRDYWADKKATYDRTCESLAEWEKLTNETVTKL